MGTDCKSALSGFYYYGARYYDPRISVWMSVDPLAEDGPDYSPYVYTFNNPINLNDPDGRWPWPSWTAIKAITKHTWKKAWKKSYNNKTYNHDPLKATVFFTADLLNKVNTYKGTKKQKPSNKDVGTAFTNKDGKNEQKNTTGSCGELLQSDGFTIAAPGPAKTGNARSNPKEVIEFLSDINGGLDLIWKATESATEVVVELKSYFATDDPNNVSQVLELENESRDTSVAPSQKSVIDNINRKKLMEARKQKDSHDRELQKKIDYFKQN